MYISRFLHKWCISSTYVHEEYSWVRQLHGRADERQTHTRVRSTVRFGTRVIWWVGECTRVTALRWLGNRDRDPPVPANHEGLCTRCRAQSRATRRDPSPARWHQRRTWQWHASHARMSASCESCNGVMSETAMMHGGRAILLVSTQAETTSSSSASDGRPADASQCILRATEGCSYDI